MHAWKTLVLTRTKETFMYVFRTCSHSILNTRPGAHCKVYQNNERCFQNDFSGRELIDGIDDSSVISIMVT